MTLVAQRAPELRRLGVQTLTLDGFSVTFAPFIPEPVAVPHVAVQNGAAAIADDEPELDAFEDPATYGLETGTPGFNRPVPPKKRKATA